MYKLWRFSIYNNLISTIDQIFVHANLIFAIGRKMGSHKTLYFSAKGKKISLNAQLPQRFLRCVSIYLQIISAKKRYSTDTWITWKTWTQTLVFYLRALNQVYLLMCWHWRSVQGACCLSPNILWSPCVIQWLEGSMAGWMAGWVDGLMGGWMVSRLLHWH